MKFLIKIFALTLVWAFVRSDNRLILQKSSEGDNEALLAVSYIRNKGKITARCELFTDKDQIKEVLESPDDMPVSTISENQMENHLEKCSKMVLITGSHENRASHTKKTDNNLVKRQISEENRQGSAAAQKQPSEDETTTLGYNGMPVIFPGTKWCGAGDKAKSYDDLGLHADTDRCCRAHDLCNDTLAPGETRNKLTNTSPFTKLSCQCDDDFYDCLDKVNSVTSNIVGNKYFNVLRRQCYKEDYPLKFPKKCNKYTSILKVTCKEWEKNTNGPKVLQWIPAKRYKKIPIPGPLTVNLPSWM